MGEGKKDCLLCARYSRCEDPRKTIGFYCSKYRSVPLQQRDFVDDLFKGTDAFEVDVASNSMDFDKLELDLVGLLEEAIDPKTQMVRDLRIDDRDLKEFPNYHSFALSKKGMNLRPFSRQDYILSNLFAEICPKCSDPDIKDVRDVPIDMKAADLPDIIQYLKWGKCPKCKRTRFDLYKKGRINLYNELAALVGQRSGKSTMLVAPACVYLLHRMVKLQRPYEVYELNPTTLVGTLVAQTFANAYEQLWLPVKTYLENSPWFVELHALLKDYENRLGEEVFKFQAQGIHYLHRQIMLYPAGPNRKLLRGKTRWFGAIDEWDFFDADDGSEQVRMHGQEVYKSLSNSMASVRLGWEDRFNQGYYNTPNAYFATASSPQHARGVLVQHVNSNLNSNEIYALHLPTWEIHPKMTRKSKVIQAYYNADAAKAERDFGANPPLADGAFLDDLEAVFAMCDPNLKNRVSIEFINKRRERGLIRAGRIKKTRIPGMIEPSVMALDAGHTRNSFAITIGHRNPDKKSPIRTITDVMLEIIPEQGKVSLDYSKIYLELIKPLIRMFNVSILMADRWNSLKLLQDAEHDFPGITAGVYSLKYSDFQLVRNHILERTFKIPKATRTLEEIAKDDSPYPIGFKYKPIDHFLLQCITVKDTGRDIEKGDKLTDDLWRAFCLQNTILLNDEYCRKHLKNRIRRQLNGGLVAANLLSQHGSVFLGGGSHLHTPQEVQDRVAKVAAASGGISINRGSGPLNVFARTR